MKCPVCHATISESKVDNNDGCCPVCDAPIYSFEEDDSPADMEDTDDDAEPGNIATVDESFLGPTEEEEEDADNGYCDSGPYEKDPFDEFLEEEERDERRRIREARRKKDETKNLCTRPPVHRRKKK